MGLIKTAIYSGAAIYGVKTLAKTAEQHHHNNQMAQQQQQQYGQQQFQQQPQRQSRDYSTSPTRGRTGSPVYYEDNIQQRRSIDPNSQQEYWYLNNQNEWCRLPAEYANMQVRGGSPPQMPVRQQQLEFDYPQQQGYYPQQQGYVEEIPQQPMSSRGLLSPEMMQSAMAIMGQVKSGKKGGKDDNKMGDVMAMFSR